MLSRNSVEATTAMPSCSSSARCAQDGVVAETGQTAEELLAALVRGEVLEQCLLADATGHDRLGDAGGAEGVDDAASWPT